MSTAQPGVCVGISSDDELMTDIIITLDGYVAGPLLLLLLILSQLLHLWAVPFGRQARFVRKVKEKMGKDGKIGDRQQNEEGLNSTRNGPMMAGGGSGGSGGNV